MHLPIGALPLPLGDRAAAGTMHLPIGALPLPLGDRAAARTMHLPIGALPLPLGDRAAAFWQPSAAFLAICVTDPLE